MTTPIYQTKTWQYANNSEARTPASVADNCAHQAWYLYALLTGNIALTDFDNNAIAGASVQGKWTLENCSDSVTVSTSDLLSVGAYNLAKWVRAGAGVAHTWVVLKSPVSMGPFYICIDFSGAAAQSAKVIMSKSAFSTGGTTTNCPTAANSVSTGDINFCNASVVTANRKRAALCTDGNFFNLMGYDTLGKFDTVFIGATLGEPRTGDAHNFWVLHQQTNNPGGVPTGSIAAFGRSAVAGSATAATAWLALSTGAGAVFEAIVTGKDATDNAFGNSAVFIVTSSPASVRGKIVDFSWFPQGSVDSLTGDMVPISGIGEFIRANYMLFPSNGVFQTM